MDKISYDAKEKYYKEKLFKFYFSSHYDKLLPKSKVEWNWIVDLMHQSFGKAFSNLKKDATILDVGCGVGYLEYYLLKKGFSNIHAIDISNEQIKIAKKCLEKYGVDSGKVKFQNIDIYKYLNSSETLKFDVITLIDVLEHFKKYEALELIEILHNALNDKGTLIIRVPNMENPFMSSPYFYDDITHETAFTRSSLRQSFLLAGFTKTEINFGKSPLPPTRNAFDKIAGLIHLFRIKILSILLPVDRDSFSLNIVAMGKKEKSKDGFQVDEDMRS